MKSFANRKQCGHCDEFLSSKVFKHHKDLYYDKNTHIWKRETADSSNNESGTSSGGNKSGIGDI